MNDKLNQFLGIRGSKGAVFTGGIWRKDGGWEGAEASWGPIAGSWPPRGAVFQAETELLGNPEI